MTENSGAIIFDHVSVTLGGRVVLDDLCCAVPAGSITVILGMSGAGKSVLMRLGLGLLRPDRGRVLVDGQELARLRARDLAEVRRGFGVAFQGGALFTDLDVAENVAFPLREHRRMSERDIRTRVDELLAAVGLAHAREMAVGDLSGGMVKRVAMARALALDPRVVFLDEPSSGLDPMTAALIDDVIRSLHERHRATYFVITHDLHSARQIADYIGLLADGRLQHFGRAAEFWASDDPRVRRLVERHALVPHPGRPA